MKGLREINLGTLLPKVFREEIFNKEEPKRRYPYKSQMGVDLTDDCVSPNSVHYLYSAEFVDLEALNKVWKYVKDIEIYIHYNDANGKEYVVRRKLEKEYESFKAALDGRDSFADDEWLTDTITVHHT